MTELMTELGSRAVVESWIQGRPSRRWAGDGATWKETRKWTPFSYEVASARSHTLYICFRKYYFSCVAEYIY
jgi:hypothetical protein